MDRLRASLLDAPIVEKEGYQYFVHPITDGVPALDPALLREIVVGVVRKADLDVDRIVTPAAMGIHVSTAVSLAADIPVTVVRKRQYGLEGEVALSQVTGYSASEMYINGVDPGDRVLVLDDVLSTGGTLDALTDALAEIGAEVADAVAVIGKVDEAGDLAETGCDVKTLVDVDVVGGSVVLVDEDGTG